MAVGARGEVAEDRPSVWTELSSGGEHKGCLVDCQGGEPKHFFFLLVEGEAGVGDFTDAEENVEKKWWKMDTFCMLFKYKDTYTHAHCI